MAYIYEKADPKNKKTKRWMGVVSIGGEEVRVALRLMVHGNKRYAQQRVTDLQREIDTGYLTDATKLWMGDQTFMRITVGIARSKIATPQREVRHAGIQQSAPT